MKYFLIFTPLIILIISIFIPLVVVRGPIFSDIKISIYEVASSQLKGKNDNSAIDIPGVDKLKNELKNIKIPLAGPILIGISIVMLTAHYILFIISAIKLYKTNGIEKLFITCMSLGILFGITFLIGAIVTQNGLNDINGPSLSQKIVSVFAKAVSSVYEIKLGIAAILLTISSSVFLVIGVIIKKKNRSNK